MKATGIIRRIDELGRIVIPKEIRKTLKITEGENIEIYIDNNNQIILKKYSHLKNLKDFAQKFTDSIYSSFKENILITDTNNIIAVSGSMKKDLINNEISDDLLNLIKKRENITSKEKKKINITNFIEIECYYKINLIISNGDCNGLIIFIKETEIKEMEDKILNISSNFLSKYLEE
jgi:AbrB family transcriptional regulator (stage V sporulation protein T)